MALEKFTVLDLMHMLPGPYGSMLLVYRGARTIKAAADQNHAMLGSPK
jgi:crotonobetainyl-CoA:carnitine CoA-transferase CaiB-like acyl-CoA transferase